MLEFLKHYYVFMLILMVVTFLLPKEEYKAYIQFFLSIFVIVLFLKPILELFTKGEPAFVYQIFEEFNAQLEQYEVDMAEEESIFEYFTFEREGE